MYDEVDDQAERKAVANGDSKGEVQQQQLQQKLKEKPGQKEKPQMDNAPPPSPAPLSIVPSTSGAAGGEEVEQEVDKVHEGQMVEQQRADGELCPHFYLFFRSPGRYIFPLCLMVSTVFV